MLFKFTAAGASLFLSNPNTFSITRVILGSSFGYTLADPPTDIQGSAVYDSTETLQREIINVNTVRFIKLLPNELGPFNFGEVACYSGSTIVAVGVNPVLISKVSSSTGEGNAIGLNIFLTITNASSYGFLKLTNSSSNLAVSNIEQVDAITPPYEGEPNIYVVNGLTPSDIPSLAFSDTYGRWNFSDKSQIYYTGVIFGTPSSTSLNVEAPFSVSFLDPSKHVIQWVSGIARGYVRQLTAIGPDYVEWNTPLNTVPGDGDEFIIVGSPSFAVGDIQGNTLPPSIVNSSLTSVGTLNNLNVAGTVTAAAVNSNVTGNADTATVLQTSRTINGVPFNGSQNILINAPASGLTGTALASNVTTSSLTSVGTLNNLNVAGSINAGNLSGTNTGDQTITITGDASGSGTGSFPITFVSTGVSAGAYNFASFTVDAKGRILSATSGGVATPSVDGLMSAADKSKLNSIASGATSNSSDAVLLSRANHTGTQLSSTVSDFNNAADARVSLLRTELNNAVDPTEGSGIPGYGGLVAYPVGSSGAKLQEIRSITDYDASTAATDNLSDINAALAAQRLLLIPTGDFDVSSDLINTLGSEMWGIGRILKPITNGHQQLNISADRYQHIFGYEYLYAVYTKLRARGAFLATFSGDSTTAGDAIVDADALIHNLVKNLVADYGFKITSVNAGHSGATAEQWRTTYLAGDLATNPDLYIIRWGINDPGWNKVGTAGTIDAWEAEQANRRDITDYATSMRAALTTIRATKSPADMGIILMTPNSTSDSPNGRDEKWYEQVRLVLRKAARDFQCGFIDTYSLLPDSRNAANKWMDDPFADGRAVHPLDVMNRMIAPHIASMIVPDGISYTNVASGVVIPAISVAPQLYPVGYSTWRISTWTINGTAIDGALINFRSADDISYQTVISYNTEMRPCVRTSDSSGTGWREWSSSPPQTLGLSNGWASAGRDLTYDKQGGQVLLTGRISSGTTTAGTVIATLPVGYRPSFDCYYPVLCGASLSTAAVVNVQSNGNIAVISVPNNTLLDLSAVKFTTY